MSPNLSDMTLFLTGILGTFAASTTIAATTGAWWIWFIAAVGCRHWGNSPTHRCHLPADIRRMTVQDLAFTQVIHAPHRLRICAMLSAAHKVEFAVLQEQLGVPKSSLSKTSRYWPMPAPSAKTARYETPGVGCGSHSRPKRHAPTPPTSARSRRSLRTTRQHAHSRTS